MRYLASSLSDGHRQRADVSLRDADHGAEHPIRQVHFDLRLTRHSHLRTLLVSGGYGDLVVIPADRAIALPNTVSDKVPRTFGMTGFTAWHLLHTTARIQPGGETQGTLALLHNA